jgi:hypothetical protein
MNGFVRVSLRRTAVADGVNAAIRTLIRVRVGFSPEM